MADEIDEERILASGAEKTSDSDSDDTTDGAVGAGEDT